jgi:hypothetical protein
VPCAFGNLRVLVTHQVLLVTYTEFAERVGVSRPAISKAVKTRLLDAVVMKNGKPMISLDRGLELWSAGNRREARAKAPAPSTLPTRDAVAEAVRQLPDDAIPDLGISIERKEHYRAELAKIDAMHRREELGSIADMRREAFGLAKSVREAVLGIVPRVSSDLAAAGDRFEVERLLEQELVTALRVLADG